MRNQAEGHAGRIRQLVDRVHHGNVRLAARAIDAVAKGRGLPGLPHRTLASLIAPPEKGGVANPRIDTLRPIADYYGATLDWLLDGRGEAPQVLLVDTPAEELRDAVEEHHAWWQIVDRLALDPITTEKLHQHAMLPEHTSLVLQQMAPDEPSPPPKGGITPTLDRNLLLIRERADGAWRLVVASLIADVGIERARLRIREWMSTRPLESWSTPRNANEKVGPP